MDFNSTVNPKRLLSVALLCRAEEDQPVLSPSRQAPKEPAPLLESLLSRVKRSVSSSSPQVPPVSRDGNGSGPVRQDKGQCLTVTERQSAWLGFK